MMDFQQLVGNEKKLKMNVNESIMIDFQQLLINEMKLIMNVNESIFYPQHIIIIWRKKLMSATVDIDPDKISEIVRL